MDAGGTYSDSNEHGLWSDDSGNPEPMSHDDWEKELADMKGGVGHGPDLPEGPVRRPTPPPGGFKVPTLEELKEKMTSESESADSPVHDEDVDEEEDDDDDDDHDSGESGSEDSAGISSRASGSSSISVDEIEAALVKTTGSRKAVSPESRVPARSRKATSLVISMLLFLVMAFSVAAGYHFRARRGVEYFMTKLKSDDPALQSYARDSLSNLGAIAIPSLEKLVESGNESEVLAGVDTLALIDSEESVSILMKLTTHENANVRKRALAGLGERAAPQAFSNVRQQISSTDHETRLCAITALENFDPQESVPVLLELLDDEDWQIRNEAAKMLTRITGQELGIPKSTSTPAVLDMIRQRWHTWWEENGSAFERPIGDGE